MVAPNTSSMSNPEEELFRWALMTFVEEVPEHYADVMELNKVICKKHEQGEELRRRAKELGLDFGVEYQKTQKAVDLKRNKLKPQHQRTEAP